MAVCTLSPDNDDALTGAAPLSLLIYTRNCLPCTVAVRLIASMLVELLALTKRKSE